MVSVRHVRMAARFAAHRLRSLHPYEVQALLLNACNLRCSYCRCPEMRIPTMDTARWRSILARLGELGTLRIKFQGGEPTLRPDFVELCAAAREAGILAAVVTNGLRVAEDPSLLDELDECVVSIDSLEAATHESARGPGSHAPALAALETAVARGLRTYAVMVVRRDNLEHIGPLLDWCEARGIGLHAQPVIFGLHYTDEAARPDLGLDDGQVRELHRRLAAWKRAGRPLMFSSAAYENVLAWPDFSVQSTRCEGTSTCMAGRSYVHIEANGDVWPCQQHSADFTPMNIVTDGLDAALTHVRRHDCGDCFAAYLNERKMLFGLRPRAVWELVRRG